MTSAQLEELMAGSFSTPDDSIKADLHEKVQMWESLSFDELVNKMINSMVEFVIHLVIAILVFYIGKFVINKLWKIAATVFVRRNLDRSLATFILSFIRIVLYMILVVTVIGILGIETSSFLAIFASAGVAIGLALSGTLQNFAGGVLILLLKPYRIGDYIEAQGYAGTVKEIQVFSTVLTTPDNKSIIIPNGGLSTSSVNNYSKEDYRRVDWTISISYGDDMDTARRAILEILESDGRIVKKHIEDDRSEREKNNLEAEAAALEQDCKENPDQDKCHEEERRGWLSRIFRHRHKVKTLGDMFDERHRQVMANLPKADRSPFVALGVLNSSSIDVTVRAWTRSSDYWGVFFDMNERFYKELPSYGLSFPFPQMDVHLDQRPAKA